MQKRLFTTRKVLGNLPVKQGDKYRPGDDILDKDYLEGSVFDVLSEFLDIPCIPTGMAITEDVGANTLTFSPGEAILPYEPSNVPLHDFDGTFLNSITSPKIFKVVKLESSLSLPITFTGLTTYVTLLAGDKDEYERKYVQNPSVSYFIVLSTTVRLAFTSATYYPLGVPVGVITGTSGAWALTLDTGTGNFSDIHGRNIRVKSGSAHNVPTLDGAGLIPSQYIPPQFREVTVLNNIGERDAIVNLFEGLQVFVVDATADTTVKSGGAAYVWGGANWVKFYEAEGIDVNVDLTNTPVKTSNYTASSGERVLCDVSAGGFTVTFPANPTNGDRVAVADVASSIGDAKLLNIARGNPAHKIINVAEDFQLDVPKTAYTFLYTDVYGWVIVDNAPNAYLDTAPAGGSSGLNTLNTSITLTAGVITPVALPGSMSSVNSFILTSYRSGEEVSLEVFTNTLSSISVRTSVTGDYTISAIFW